VAPARALHGAGGGTGLRGGLADALIRPPPNRRNPV
jgi:hypothetical protein